MRRFAMILLLAGMLMAVGIIEAQEEETVRIFCAIESHEAAQGYNLFYDSNNCISSIVNPFIEFLQSQNINIEFVPDFTEGSDISLVLEFATQFEPIFSIYIENPNPSLPSPILYAYKSTDTPIQLSFWAYPNPEKLNRIASALIGVYLYETDACGDALPYLERGERHFLAGNCYLVQENYLDAISAYDLDQEAFLAELGAEHNEAYTLPYFAINKAWALIQLDRTEEALELLSEVELTPTMAQERIAFQPRLAQIYALTFDYDSAIVEMDSVIRLANGGYADDTTLAELYTIRGKIIFLLYEWDRVLENFNHAIELDPNYALAYFERGILHYTMTQRENALADFQRYLELEPDGLYAEEAAQYIESIEIELEALGG
jgi:tetratricopeptide (TPR) repeat protein